MEASIEILGFNPESEKEDIFPVVGYSLVILLHLIKQAILQSINIDYKKLLKAPKR